MSKDFKEKYERVCALKDRIIGIVEGQLSGDLSSVDAKELGEVTDMAKDFAEMMKLCCEAEYYHKVTEAMNESSGEEKSHYLNKYIPEYEGRFYTPIDYAMNPNRSGMRYRYTDPRWDDTNHNSYYNEPSGMHYNNSEGVRDLREGRSGISRRTYMDVKETGNEKSKVKELEHYMKDLSVDMTELIMDMDPKEKEMVKQKLSELSAKIV